MQLLWDQENLEHIARHGVDEIEFEDVLFDPGKIPIDAYNTRDEKRIAYIGKTEAGRILFIVLTTGEEGWRPVIARDADPGEKRRYRR